MIKIFGLDGIPSVIPDYEVNSICKIVASGFSTEPYQFLKSGQKVRVNSGPVKGMEGYLVSVVNKSICKIAASVSVLEKTVVITVVDGNVIATHQ